MNEKKCAARTGMGPCMRRGSAIVVGKFYCGQHAKAAREREQATILKDLLIEASDYVRSAFEDATQEANARELWERIRKAVPGLPQ